MTLKDSEVTQLYQMERESELFSKLTRHRFERFEFALAKKKELTAELIKHQTDAAHTKVVIQNILNYIDSSNMGSALAFAKHNVSLYTIVHKKLKDFNADLKLDSKDDIPKTIKIRFEEYFKRIINDVLYLEKQFKTFVKLLEAQETQLKAGKIQAYLKNSDKEAGLMRQIRNRVEKEAITLDTSEVKFVEELKIYVKKDLSINPSRAVAIGVTSVVLSIGLSLLSYYGKELGTYHDLQASVSTFLVTLGAVNGLGYKDSPLFQPALSFFKGLRSIIGKK